MLHLQHNTHGQTVKTHQSDTVATDKALQPVNMSVKLIPTQSNPVNASCNSCCQCHS